MDSTSKRKLICSDDDVKSPCSSVSDQEVDKTPVKMPTTSKSNVVTPDFTSDSPSASQLSSDGTAKPAKRAKLITLSTSNGHSPISSNACTKAETNTVGNESKVSEPSPKVSTAKRATLITLSPATNKDINNKSESNDMGESKEKSKKTESEFMHQYSATKIELLSSDAASSSEESDKISQGTRSSVSPKPPRRVTFKTIS